MSTRLRQRMHQDLQLAGLAQGTQKAYIRAVKRFAAHFHKPPDQISEQEFREYLLYLKNERHYAPASLKVAASGILFFYTHTVPRDWPTFKTLSIPRPRSLPDVLSIDEVRRLIDAVRTPHNKAFFWTVYSLGLRLQEALNLQVGDIDRAPDIWGHPLIEAPAKRGHPGFPAARSGCNKWVAPTTGPMDVSFGCGYWS